MLKHQCRRLILPVVVLGSLIIVLLSNSHRDGHVNEGLNFSVSFNERSLAAIKDLRQLTGDESLVKSFDTARYRLRRVDHLQSSAFPRATHIAVSHDQQLRAWFDNSGLLLSPGAVKGAQVNLSAWRSELQLKGYSYGSQVNSAISTSQKLVSDNRIEYSHIFSERLSETNKWKIDEWFENKPAGIEQGFTIDQAPPAVTGTGAEPLSLIISVDGTLKARLQEDGQSIGLVNQSDEVVLRYGHLAAFDATGRHLPAQMKSSNSGKEIVIEVSDRGAVYPITVDPLIWQETKLSYPGPSFERGGQYFGMAVDGTSQNIVVGAPYEDTGVFNRYGAVYVFERNDTGWVVEERLVPPNLQPGAANLEYGFGMAVKISGDTIVVGAPNYPLGPCQSNWIGSAYVFVRKNRQWVQEALLMPEPSNPQHAWAFGERVAISGDTIAITRYPVCGTPDRIGHVDVYARTKVTAGGVTVTGWVLQTSLVSGFSPPTGTYESFGFSIALDGNKLLVGGAPAFMGVMLFERTGTNWLHTQSLFSNDGVSSPLSANFGYSVAMSRDRIIIGAADAGPTFSQPIGAAYIFEPIGPTWFQKQRIEPLDPTPQLHFGQRVDISGDLAIVGCPLDDTAGFDNSGAAYIFERATNGTWSQQTKLLASDPNTFSLFGASVAINGGRVVVGAPRHSVDTRIYQGQTYIYGALDTDGDALPDDWELNGVTIDGHFINLPAMGANPVHKDIFIHADWMANDPLRPEAVYKPNPKALKIVADAFRIAPVKNPDNKPGINLHVDAGQESIMNHLTGAKWGPLSQAGIVPFKRNIGSFNSSGDYIWTEVDNDKAIFFDAARRRTVFHYALFANNYSADSSSGISRDIGAADFIVTLGNAPVPGGTIKQQAGTFMHELGHNLGIHHGGDDDINYKPNYQSIMNYYFQMTGLLKQPNGQQFKYDYSRRALPDISELALDENIGISDPDKHLTFWARLTRINTPPGNNKCLQNPSTYYKLFLPGQALDFNCDGVKNTGTVQTDVNGDAECISAGAVLNSSVLGDDIIRQLPSGGIYVLAGPNRRCESPASGGDVLLQNVGFVEPDVLTGFLDWPVIVYDGGGTIGSAGLGMPGPLETKADEASIEQLLREIPPDVLEAENIAPTDEVTVSPATGPVPLNVNFDGSASTAVNSTIVSWTWDFGDGTTGTGPTVAHTYTTPGDYNASLTVTDSNGNLNLVPLLHLITVTPAAPTPTPTPTPTATPTPQPTPTPGGTPGVGDADPTFEANISSNVSTQIRTVLVQPDGKTLVGGEFEAFAGCARQGLARLNADGSCDTSFNPGLAFSLERIGVGNLPFRVKPAVRALALQPDGKILVGLAYDRCCGTQPGKMVVRLNTDGTLDTTFNLSGLGSQGTWDATVYGIGLQPDGKVIIVGNFAFDANSVFGPNTALAIVARLNQDGSLDTTFNASAGSQFTGGFRPDGIVNAVAVQSDGKIIIGGNFFTVGGNVARIGIARLNSDGTNDSTYNVLNQQSGIFSSELSQNTNVFAIALQPDGKAVIAGDLRRGNQPEAFMRLNTDGSRDQTFASGAQFGGQFGSGRSLAIQTDGKIVISGDFRITTTPTRNYIARLNSDGTLDTTFDTGTGTFPPGGNDQRSVDAVALQPDGKVIMGGRFEFYKDQPAQAILRLDTAGNRDVTFDPSGAGYNAEAYVVVKQPDQKLLVGYNSVADSKWTLLNAHRTAGIGRLNPDGSTDTSFTSPMTPGFSSVFAIAVQQDGKILVGGTFRLQGSNAQVYLVRLNANGSVDATFTGNPNDHVQAIVIQSDGKVIVGGSFTTVNGGTQFRLSRLNTNGAVDGTFASNGVGGTVRTLVQQPDGKIIVAGSFNGLNSTLRNNIARINADGSLDNSFDPGAGPDGGVVPVVVQPDGKIIIGGFFQNYAGVARPFIARLESNGALDNSFNPVNPDQRVVNALALQTDGMIDVGCASTGAVANTAPPNVIFRLNSDGSLDSSFPPNAEIELDVQSRLSFVNSLLLDSDEKLIIGGNFDVVNDAAHLALVRILIKPPSVATPTPTPTPTATPTPTPTPSPSPTPTPTPFPTPTPTSTFQFSPASYTINEDCTSIMVTVTRTGILTTPTSVSYATSNGTASERSDYTLALGTLQFAPGETAKSFPLLISEDSFVEGNETFNVSLVDKLGAGFGSATTATVQIIDDASEPATNAIDDAPTYVCQHYHDFLNRQPDPAGLAFWTNEITSCGSDVQCLEVKRINVSAAFYLSIEFQQTGYFVERIALAAFGDGHGTSTLTGTARSISIPVVRQDSLLADSQLIGKGVIVGEPGWEQRLETNKQAFVSEFAARRLLTILYPIDMSPADFVDRMFLNAGITPTTAERNSLINEFGPTGVSADAGARGRVLRFIGELETVNSSQFNKAFVLMQYIGYLRRNPNDPQDTDYSGFDFWLTKLNQFNGNFVNADMVKAFLVSTEYRSRFGIP